MFKFFICSSAWISPVENFDNSSSLKPKTLLASFPLNLSTVFFNCSLITEALLNFKTSESNLAFCLTSVINFFLSSPCICLKLFMSCNKTAAPAASVLAKNLTCSISTNFGKLFLYDCKSFSPIIPSLTKPL